MNNKKLYTLLIILCIIGFWVFDNFYTPDSYTNPDGDGAGTASILDYLPQSTTGNIVVHDYFVLSYNEPYEQAEWVAYPLKKEHLTYDDRDRPYLIEDPKVKTKSADWKNYKGSGYDRGHLCPAGDRRFSKYAYNETFYTSNISPQDQEFNAGIWNRLEQQIRNWSKMYGDLIVITGGVLEPGLEEIGEEDVDVPDAFFKIVVKGDGKDAKLLAFLFPNKESNRPLSDFLITVDTLEYRTGIDFFEKQPEDWQGKLEASVEKSGWEF